MKSPGGPVNLTGWRLTRKVEGCSDLMVYMFPSDTVLGKGKQLKVWGKAYRANQEPQDLCTDYENWGIGIKSMTRLFDEDSNERSFFDQSIIFSTL